MEITVFACMALFSVGAGIYEFRLILRGDRHARWFLALNCFVLATCLLAIALVLHRGPPPP